MTYLTRVLALATVASIFSGCGKETPVAAVVPAAVERCNPSDGQYKSTDPGNPIFMLVTSSNLFFSYGDTTETLTQNACSVKTSDGVATLKNVTDEGFDLVGAGGTFRFVKTH